MGFFRSKKSEQEQEPERRDQQTEHKEYIPGAGGAIVSKSILNGTARLKWLFRQESTHGNGWVAFGDTDTQEYVNDANNMAIVDFNTLASLEPAVLKVFYLPPGADLEFRDDATGQYFVDTKTGQEIREPVKHPAQAAFERNLKFLNQEEYPLSFFQELFQKNALTEPFVLGQADFPTGEIVLADPLAYLGGKYETCLDRRIPAGRYPVTLSILRSPLVGLRVAAAKVTVGEGPAVRYEIAMPKGYRIEDLGKPRVWTFFGVDTGLACITDQALSEAYASFMGKWQAEHPGQNKFTDYFAPLFENSYQEAPQVQAPGGSFLLWTLPDPAYQMPLFSSGMGDGIFSAYWGLDESGAPVELVVPFMNPSFFAGV